MLRRESMPSQTPSNSHDPSIRLATAADAGELARLISLLEHPVTDNAIAAVWDSWTAAGNLALVAEGEDSLLGAITLHRMTVLHRPKPVGRITLLVVDLAARGQGLGRALIRAAEEAVAQTGCGLLEVTSHARHSDAHDFYKHLGYEQTSLRFARVL
jgi:GNAT superfamily N-acetyltransferase